MFAFCSRANSKKVRRGSLLFSGAGEPLLLLLL